MSPRDRARVHAALLTVQLAFGLWPVAGAIVLEHITPRALIGYRTMVGAPLLFLAARAWTRVPRRDDLLRLAGLAALGVAANQLLFAEGLLRAGPINASILSVMIPAFTLAIAAALGRERLTKSRTAGVGVALVGTLILVRAERFDLQDRQLVGGLFILANTVAYAAYLVLVRGVIARVGSLRVVAWVFTFGALWALPFTGPHTLNTAWTALPPSVLASLAFILFGATLTTYALNAYALARVHSSVVAVYVYLQPLVATVATWLVFDRGIDLRTALAGGVIVAGVAIANRREP